ncbi:MAG: BREX system ATP-binding domain-containing protein [Acidimicrobiales bacterium]
MPERSVQRRRALEALRAGVPNRDAVEVLGSMQVGVEDSFTQLLDSIAEPYAPDATAGERPASGGILIGGGFGTGKSHVLEHLSHLALSRRFVVSKVIISKETPLYDPAKVFRAAIESAKVPGRPGSAVDELAVGLKVDSPAYASLYRWVHADASPVDSRFAATLFLHEYNRGDEELREAIVRFWAGDPMPVADLRRRLKETGAVGTYPLAKVSAHDLALHRFRFISRLARAAGFAGWVVLIDEVELIGRYAQLQRARSYAEVARWVRGDREDPEAPLCAVLTTVDDFETQVLIGKNDPELIPKRLRSKDTVEYELLAAQAEAGMRVLEREQIQLQPPGQDELDRTYAALREIHAQAYGWDPPEVAGLERLPSNRMRQYVRGWINEWDLRRLDPAYAPEMTASELTLDLGPEDEEPEQG